ncbi:MAG: hypothetical protein V4792_05345 [Pseudomonadota bacterium]
MTRGDRAGEAAIIAIALAAACGAALALYSNSDPRNANAQYQRRQNELHQQEKDKEDRARSQRQSALSQACTRAAIVERAVREPIPGLCRSVSVHIASAEGAGGIRYGADGKPVLGH